MTSTSIANRTFRKFDFPSTFSVLCLMINSMRTWHHIWCDVGRKPCNPCNANVPKTVKVFPVVTQKVIFSCELFSCSELFMREMFPEPNLILIRDYIFLYFNKAYLFVYCICIVYATVSLDGLWETKNLKSFNRRFS